MYNKIKKMEKIKKTKIIIKKQKGKSKKQKKTLLI